ncbi:MAG: acetyl-CoA C-acetyltransferase [Dermatophilaceae bacterium]
MTEAVIVSTVRSPIGRAMKGSLKDIRPDDLSAQMIHALLAKIPQLDTALIDDLYWGCAEPAGRHGNNLARVVSVLAGYDNIPGATVNRFCASSVQTTRMAYHAIKVGEGSAFISGGVECVSQYTAFAGAGGSNEGDKNPLFAEAEARGQAMAMSNEVWHDPREDGKLPDIYMGMGQTAENIVTSRGFKRQQLDEWGVLSQNRAEAAQKSGFFAAEITPVTLPDGTVVSTDDGIRAGTTYEAIAGLKPVFRPEGACTAGNSCPLNDGAAAVMVMSDTMAKDLGITPIARVVATGVTGLSPELMGMGPVGATQNALKNAGMTIKDMDLYEINEAFAVQVVASAEDLGMDTDKLNVHGGAIALGHPFGSTGARITTTLLHGLQERDGTFGLETMCVGGGQGMAIIYERLS